jgi:ferredoxin-thioredoxin reductase catalytic chain
MTDGRPDHDRGVNTTMNEAQTRDGTPSERALRRIRDFVEKFREKCGTSVHPNPEVTEAVVFGLAAHIDELGRPLCPCNFYPDKAAELTASRRWVCACDEMKRYKYCHCLLFVSPAGLPITEYLPEEHEGRQIYDLVHDPTPDKGREARHQIGSHD